MIRATDSSSTFDLAKYAAEQLRPLVDQLQGGSLEIDLALGMPFFAEHKKDWSVSIVVHEGSAIGRQGEYVTYQSLIDTSDDVDFAVLKLREHLATLKAAA